MLQIMRGKVLADANADGDDGLWRCWCTDDDQDGNVSEAIKKNHQQQQRH